MPANYSPVIQEKKKKLEREIKKMCQKDANW